MSQTADYTVCDKLLIKLILILVKINIKEICHLTCFNDLDLETGKYIKAIIIWSDVLLSYHLSRTSILAILLPFLSQAPPPH